MAWQLLSHKDLQSIHMSTHCVSLWSATNLYTRTAPFWLPSALLRRYTTHTHTHYVINLCVNYTKATGVVGGTSISTGLSMPSHFLSSITALSSISAIPCSRGCHWSSHIHTHAHAQTHTYAGFGLACWANVQYDKSTHTHSLIVISFLCPSLWAFLLSFSIAAV